VKSTWPGGLRYPKGHQTLLSNAEAAGAPVLSEPSFTVQSMAKAARVLAALKRDGWTETRRSGPSWLN
jgi:hypothetical protein